MRSHLFQYQPLVLYFGSTRAGYQTLTNVCAQLYFQHDFECRILCHSLSGIVLEVEINQTVYHY